MSFVKPYHIKCMCQHNTNIFEINAIVHAGNSKVAIQKFMIGLVYNTIDGKHGTSDMLLPILRVDTHFTKHKDLASGVKEYANSDNTIHIVTHRLNRNSEFTFIESHRIMEEKHHEDTQVPQIRKT